MPFSIFGMNLATLFQVVALLVVLIFEFRATSKRWRIGVIAIAIIVSLVVGVLDWRHQVSQSEIEKERRAEETRVLNEIEAGVSEVEEPIAEISNNSRVSLSELRALQERNADQRQLINSLTTSVEASNAQYRSAQNQYLAAQEQVVALNQQIVALQERIDRNSVAAAAARQQQAIEMRKQTEAANRAAAQAACEASYREWRTPTSSGSSQTYVNLEPYGGGRCLNGVYYPPR